MSKLLWNTRLFSISVSYSAILGSEKLFFNTIHIVQYLIILLVVVVPATFMDLAVGQYSQKSAINVWDLCPLFRGVGYCGFLITIFIQSYYNIICTYLSFFTFASFSTEVAWTSCNHSWAHVNCFTTADNRSRWYNCIEQYNKKYCSKLHWESSAQQYWMNYVLNVDRSYETGPIQSLGKLNIELLIHSAINNLLICLAASNGIKWSLFLTVFPCIQLLVLFFISFVDEGGPNGLYYILTTPDFSSLWSLKSWTLVTTLCLEMSGMGLGYCYTIGAKYPFRTPILFRSTIVNLGMLLFCVLYGVTTFNFIGSLSYHTNIPLQELLLDDESLCFSKISRALVFTPFNVHIMVVLFYSNVYLLSFRATVVTTIIQMDALFDVFPKLKKRRIFCRIIYCSIIFGFGLIFITRAGFYIRLEVRDVLSQCVLPFLTIFHFVGVVFCYGIINFCNDIHFMLGLRPVMIFKICLVLCPIIIWIILIYQYIKNSHDYTKLQWVIQLIPLIVVGGYAIYYMIKQKFKNWFKPSEHWGPHGPILKKSRLMFTAHSMTKEYIYRQSRLNTNNFDNGENEQETDSDSS